jgi:catechol 2,3-dioxygenase
MGATTRDIFGGAGAPEPATPGSYGEAPRGFRLPDETHLGRVCLQVSDLSRSLAYYEGTLGFRVVRREGGHAELAAHGDDTVIVELREHSGASPAPRRGRLGLFHFAILLPDRETLGRFVRHLGEIGAGAGASDHLVSEALYLQDPDNLGIEVYSDRPRSAWKRIGRELMMATDPLDLAGLVKAAGDARWTGMPAGTTIGHVHLHVGDIAGAAAFYSEGLGFDRMVWHYPGALFLGAGGYHHHLGTNTWAGSGAKAPAAGDARLVEWTVVLPDDARVAEAARSLEAGGFSVEREGGSSGPMTVLTRDPWGTQLRLTTGSREA